MTQRLIDGFNRLHNRLRISVTDRCNVRCVYCMPEAVEFQPRAHLLRFEEIARFVRVAVDLGIEKVRFTGGEPLLRKELCRLVELIVHLPGIRDVGLTTNGLLLPGQAQSLFGAGLRRINISLDTLDREHLRRIARRDVLTGVLAGIDAAQTVGFHPIKINAVALAETTPEEIVQLARFCRERQLQLRFIEFMPLDADASWDRGKLLLADDLLAILAAAGLPLLPPATNTTASPAMEYRYADGGGTLGIIASVSKPFCQSCNRIRLTADGKLRHCLFGLEELDVKALMRSGGTDASISKLIRTCVANKWEGHQMHSSCFVRPERTMHTIGG